MTPQTPQIFALAAFLTVMWGIYLVSTIRDYLRARGSPGAVAAIRRMVVAIAVFSLPASVVFRTATALLGVDDQLTAQIAFYALLGPNVVGCIFAVVSLRFD